MLFAVTATIAALGPVSPADASWNHPLPKDWYEGLARCETGLNVKHRTRTYVTAFGMTRHAFNLYADTHPSRAHTLTFAQQARVVDRLAWFGHTENGRKQWPVGPWGWGCLKNSPKLRMVLCRSTHPKVQKWKRGC